MAIAQPVSTDALNSPDHSLLHRIIAADAGATVQSLTVDSSDNVKVLNGNLVIGTSGKGIDFSADGHAAGMTSELLDDYEEGTFTVTITPATSGTVTLDASWNLAQYTKIGRLVTVSGNIKVASVSSPVGKANFNLPFTTATLTKGAGYCGGVVAFHLVDYASAGWLTPRTSGGSATFALISTADNAAWAWETADIFTAGDEITFSLQFVTA